MERVRASAETLLNKIVLEGKGCVKMISILIKKDGFTISGHSNYDEHGKDIVCASVTAISQTALLGLGAYEKIEFEMEDGNTSVEVEDIGQEGEAILYAMKLGLKSIAGQYPEYVEIFER